MAIKGQMVNSFPAKNITKQKIVFAIVWSQRIIILNLLFLPPMIPYKFDHIVHLSMLSSYASVYISDEKLLDLILCALYMEFECN